MSTKQTPNRLFRFFRYIRKSLIETNSTRKYILYAIGEILLVVIGILIALQINNMNENRKTRAFEETMLNEVRTQLMLDTGYFNLLIERCTRVDTSIQSILEFYDSGSSDMDYFNLHTRNIRSGYNFQYHAGAYEALKASGVEKISNNEIRAALIDLYDFKLPRFKNFLNIYQSPEWHLMEEDLERQIFDYQIRTYKNGRKFYVAGNYGLEKIDHPVFKKYLDMKEEESSQGIGRIGGAINEVNKVLALLDEELGIKNN